MNPREYDLFEKIAEELTKIRKILEKRVEDLANED
jgi:hypothetical protein